MNLPDRILNIKAFNSIFILVIIVNAYPVTSELPLAVKKIKHTQKQHSL